MALAGRLKSACQRVMLAAPVSVDDERALVDPALPADFLIARAFFTPQA
ncbi:MAG: hypothetical protein QOF90_2692 [Acetobacteraceae bacterium]|jgi:hypothetical protein|nr:hypothetical protein [Acetobacteraceae bacterium]